MTAAERITAAEQAMATAKMLYDAALEKFNKASGWERITQALSKKVNFAKAALDEAQQNYMNAVAGDEFSNSTSSGTSLLVPVLAVSIVAIAIVYFTIKRKK